MVGLRSGLVSLAAFALVVLCITLPAYSQQQPLESTWVISPNNQRVAIPLHTINGRTYVSEAGLAKALAGTLHRKPGMSEISTSQGDITLFQDCFLIKTITTNGEAVSQLPLPVLLRGKELVLPWQEIRYVLNYAGMISETLERKNLKFSAGGIDQLERVSDDALSITTGPVTSETTDKNVEMLGDDNPQMHVPSTPLAAAALEEVPSAVEMRETGILRRGSPRDDRTTGGAFGPYGERYTLPDRLRRPGVRDVQSSDQVQQDEPSRQFESRPLREQAPTLHNRGRYVLPKDLRRTLRDTSKSQTLEMHSPALNSSDEPPKNVLAGLLSPEFLNPNVSVVSVEIDTIPGHKVRISLKCDGPLPSGYQRPEIDGTRVILRIPDVNNKVDLKKEYDGVLIVQEHIRNIQLYRMRFPAAVKDCDFRRVGVDGLEFVVYLAGAPTHSVSLEQASKSWALDVIVIDPGHGGKDPGAVSRNGTREKDVALQLSLKLAEKIRATMPNTKVILTRDDDTFIPLYRRGQIANENNGKLFISIHLNSVAGNSRTARGFETFILRPGRNDDAAEIARRENASIRFEEDPSKYKKLTNEEWIVVEMAQRAFVKFSEKFAEVLQGEVAKKVKLNNRGVKQAGFLVLVGASMPNVLFEAAFLSNSTDEKYITSAKGQEETVEGMMQGILKYAEHYEKELGGN